MAVFDRHYSVTEANSLLPSLRSWLQQIHALDARLGPLSREHADLLAKRGEYNVGGPQLGEYLVLSVQWRALVDRIFALDIQVKDLERGLCDFPHLLDTGEEVFLCWQLAEDEVAYWHHLQSGFDGRVPLGMRRNPRRDPRWREPE